MMKKSLIGILILISALLLAFWGVGHFANPDYTGAVEQKFNMHKSHVWNEIKDYTNLQQLRREIVKIEVLKSDSLGPLEWKEYTDMDGFIEFKRHQYKEEELYAVEMVKSSFGMTGVWTYELESVGSQTLVRIKEKSSIDHAFVRSALVLAGRDSNLKQEMALIKQAINN